MIKITNVFILMNVLNLFVRMCVQKKIMFSNDI